MNQLTNLSAEISAQHEQDAKDLTRILPASKKVYIQGSRPDIQVPMREIELTETPTGLGGEYNPPVMVYDTSGVYTDTNVSIDLNKGLPNVRENWIEERNDTEMLDSLSSSFGQERLRDIRTADIRFAHIQKPRRAKAGKMSRRCIMPNKALLPLKWNTSLFVKISVNVKGSMHVNTRGKTLVRIT
jgi:phosphomethylpyrimidine synthase